MMKKYCIALAAIIISGCSIADEEFELKTRQVSFNATFADETRTSYEGSGKVNWSEGDTVRYFSMDNGTVGYYTVAESGPNAEIDAEVSETATYFIAAYGGNGISDNSGNSMTLTGAIESVQDGSFANAHISVAKTSAIDSGTLVFRNITSLIKFSLDRPDVTRMTFTSNDGTKVHGSGNVVITFNEDGEPTGRFPENEGGSSIEVTTAGPGEYFIAMLPDTLASGFTCDCYAADGKKIGTAQTNDSLIICRNDIINLGTIDPHIAEIEDLSIDESANCYVVSSVGDFQFKTIRGNGSTDPSPIDGITRAKVIWETNNTNTSPGIGGVVKDIVYENGYVRFTSVSNGNALIGVYDESNNILWSWHIWVCLGYDPYESGQLYTDKNGDVVCRMMDRNLGALSATPGSNLANGLFYEWGRKDPFPGSNTKGTIVWTTAAASSETGNVEYATAHPTIFIYGNGSSYIDWLYPGHDDTLWSNDKTEYDPCPPGWKIPDETAWTRALNKTTPYSGIFDNKCYGVHFEGIMGNDASIWYPAAGYRDPGSPAYGIPQNMGRYGFYWSTSTNNNESGMFKIYFTNDIYPKSFARRSYGASVRCVAEIAEPEPIIIPVESISLDAEELTLNIYHEHQLTCTFTPDEATDKSIEWTSDNSDVATVNDNGLITACSSGDCWITATSPDGPTARCHIIVPEAGITDLSTEGTANCYIVSTTGTYKFKTARGNSNELISGGSNACVVWESYCNSTYINTNDLLFNVRYSNNEISFEIPPVMRNGNAVIALRDSSNKILWSWHIWICKGYEIDSDAQQYDNGAIMMGRNLGALSSEKGSIESLGLLYQWGRKDPFLNTYRYYRAEPAFSSADPMPGYVSSSSVTYALEHPSTYIVGGSSGQNWSNEQIDDLWSSSKTIYDPCPAGWRVPDGGPAGVWASSWSSKDGLNGTTIQGYGLWQENNYGLDAGSAFSDGSQSIWYPATGYRLYSDSKIYGESMYGMYWSCTTDGQRSFDMYNSSDILYLAHHSYRAYGAAVRCLKEGTYNAVHVSDVTMNLSSITISVGETAELSATVYPSNASNKNIIWSSDSNEVSVDANGIITGIRKTPEEDKENKIPARPVSIYATSVDGNKYAECLVTVR